MGQSHSKKSPDNPRVSTIVINDTPSIPTHRRNPGIERPRSGYQHVKRKLTRIELFSLHQVFDDLKTCFADDQLECIEPKRFLEHLDLPPQIEPAGVLLFKSFSYLGTFPNCVSSGAVPLSLDAFITAFVLLSGKMDTEDDDSLFEDLFFESLSILPARTTTEIARVEEIPVPKAVEPKQDQESSSLPRGLSLADLGVQFDDFDLENDTSLDDEEEEEEDGLSILKRDLVNLFELLLWIVEMERQESMIPFLNATKIDFDKILNMAERVVNSIKPKDASIGLQAEQCISHKQFRAWKERNAPHLFKTIQSFIYSKFAMCTQHSLAAMSDLVLKQDTVPVPSVSDILDPLYCSLLCWRLPERCLKNKQWERLYSGDKDGFSMNRFASHVFKYPDPTLIIIQAEATSATNSSPIPLILGAYIPEPWKSSKHYWGGSDCFMFELSPTFEVYRPTTRNDQYVYYHPDVGIAFGGTSVLSLPPKLNNKRPPAPQLDNFFITLDNSLQNGSYRQESYPEKPTFEKSALRKTFSYTFQTVDMEVFGLGNEKARNAQEKEWQFEQREAMKRAGVNIRREDQSVDKEILRMAGIINDEDRQER
ncbi:TLD-domain-containing protein [Phycomyces nitens]|nr:TLD-domain-containing protein [Phycomyces nitens]